jgi:class 3 adenylate cyclase
MMSKKYPYELFEDTRELAGFCGWSEDVYRDFLALQRETLSYDEFNQRYKRQCAILSIDMTGFTSSAINIGELQSFLRILDAQKVCIPVLKEFSASLIRCFADDIVAIFDDPHNAIDAAFETHRRIELFRHSAQASDHPTQCCIGIGCGEVFSIGPNLAQGDEMNRASKLGEDIARAKETLLTERAYDALKTRTDIRFDLQSSDDQLFPFYRVLPALSAGKSGADQTGLEFDRVFV